MDLLRCLLRRQWVMLKFVLGNAVRLLHKNARYYSLLNKGVEKVAKQNLTFLKQCGINACGIARGSTMYSSRLLTMKPMYLREVVARVEEFGLDRSSRMFHHGLIAVGLISKETAARKIQLLEELGFSRDDLLVIIRKGPNVMALSEEKIRRTVEFLKTDVGLEERYIAQRPALLLYSFERRLLPRHYLIKVIRTKGLLNCEFDYYSLASMSEKDFLQRFVDPYKGRIPGLADAYASSCSGEAANGVASLLGL
uniref:Uncharacterized protein n=1 Tax=Leersia perrieri TaxID=77586 RepID=A0A0D9WNI0_9ORYZ